MRQYLDAFPRVFVRLDCGLRQSRRSLLSVCLVLFGSLVIAAPGCGRRNLHRVTGTVRFADGSPLSLGRVVVEYGGGKGAWGRIQQDGSFTIGSLTEKDGMNAGEYRVAIKDAEIADLTKGTVEQLVHRRFQSSETSGLTFSVPEQLEWEIVVEKP